MDKSISLYPKLDTFTGAIAFIAFFLLLFERSGFALPIAAIIKKINLLIMAVFILDVCARIALAPDKLAYIKRRWFDFIAFVPLLQFVVIGEYNSFYIAIRQIIIIVILISRTRKTKN